MKLTRLPFLLLLTLLCVGCSNEELSSNVIVEESINLDNLRTASVCEESTTVIDILIEYEPGTTTAQKQVVKNTWAPIIGIISYELCPLNDLAEIWTVGCVQFNSDASPKPKNTGISVNDPDISKQTNYQSTCPDLVLINP